jgi:hypothetical protein
MQTDLPQSHLFCLAYKIFHIYLIVLSNFTQWT